MKFARKLEEGVFLKRYKRFFADIDWKGSSIVAHVANTGSMKGVNVQGQSCLFSHSDNPNRKLKFTLEMIKAQSGAWVGVNTSTPNTLVRETLEEVIGKGGVLTLGPFATWSTFSSVKPEFKLSAETRLDFALFSDCQTKRHYIEVKNVTLGEEGIAKFPDAVTERGQKHLRELMVLLEQGHSAEIVFTVQRDDCRSFAPADDIDPEYGRLLREAQRKGLRITPLVVELSPTEVRLSERVLPVIL